MNNPDSNSKPLKETCYDEATRLNNEKDIVANRIFKIIPASATTISVWLCNFSADAADDELVINYSLVFLTLGNQANGSNPFIVSMGLRI